ncbi:hypothetical protein ACWC3X_36280 [Streptomyces populi]|jgi:hypothetical protein
MALTWRYVVRPDGDFCRVANIDGSLDNTSAEELAWLWSGRDKDEQSNRPCSRCGTKLLLQRCFSTFLFIEDSDNAVGESIDDFIGCGQVRGGHGRGHFASLRLCDPGEGQSRPGEGDSGQYAHCVGHDLTAITVIAGHGDDLRR